MTKTAETTAIPADVRSVTTELIQRARLAQRRFESCTQEQVDDAVTAVAWAACKSGNAEALARQAVDDTGMGRYEDKISKLRRKTSGTLRDLQGAKSVGIIREDEILGITEIAKPMGVIAALCPSTNPEATPFNKTMMALKEP